MSASTVVTRMLITSAARILSTHRTIVRIRPIQNTKSAGVVGRWNVTGGPGGRRRTDEAAAGEADEQDEQADADADRLLERERHGVHHGLAEADEDQDVTTRPSSTITPIAPAGDRPWPVSENATMALMPRPGGEGQR